jgi:hypothetical protein
LKRHCERLIVTDVSPRCLEHCRCRFASDPHIGYLPTDGRSLAGIENHSVDFIFSLDSLVHVEKDVMEAYAQESARVLRPDGAGFVHHSNLGMYSRVAGLGRRLPRGFGLIRTLQTLFSICLLADRGITMTAALFEQYVSQAGLHCIVQELISWDRGRAVSDAFSTFVGRENRWRGPNHLVHHPDFRGNACRMARIASLYYPLPCSVREIDPPDSAGGAGSQ